MLYWLRMHWPQNYLFPKAVNENLLYLRKEGNPMQFLLFLEEKQLPLGHLNCILRLEITGETDLGGFREFYEIKRDILALTHVRCKTQASLQNNRDMQSNRRLLGKLRWLDKRIDKRTMSSRGNKRRALRCALYD